MVSISVNPAICQELEKLTSFACNWDDLEPVKTASGERRQIFEGYTNTMAWFEVHVTTLNPGNAPHEGHVHEDMEELVIVKNGSLEIGINGTKKILGPGSVVLASPGDLHGISNAGDTNASYYIIRWRSKEPVNVERSMEAGGSKCYDWNEIPASATEKGFRRQIMTRPTAMLEELEMHVTTLNAGIASHGEHVHAPEEMIILMKGEVEMSMNGTGTRLGPGSLILLVDDIPHGLRNTGSGPCEYFAFQWK